LAPTGGGPCHRRSGCWTLGQISSQIARGAYPNGSYPADNARQEAQDRRSMTVTSFDMLAGLVILAALIVTVLAVKRWDD
jgi:hypothetical protein